MSEASGPAPGGEAGPAQRAAPPAGVGAGLLGPLLESLKDGVIVFGADRRLRAVNSAFARMFGLPPGAIGAGDPLERVLRVLAAHDGLHHGLAQEAAVAQRLAVWGTPADRLERRYLASGRVHDIVRSQTAEGDVIAVHVDVTEALSRQRELDLQRVYMQSILDNITEGVTLVDARGYYIAFNRRFLELYRIDPARAAWGMHIDALYELFGDLEGLPEPERRAEQEARKWFLRDDALTRVERRLRDGRVLDVRKSALPAGGCVLTVSDITETRRLVDERAAAQARAEQASLLKSQFLARLSHEIRTPLNGVLGTAALLRLTGLDPRQRRYAEVIASSGTMLLRLIDDMLDLGRIESGGLDLRPEPTDLAALVRDGAALLEPLARERGLGLAVEAAPGPEVLADGVRIKQILLNLLTNAVKFTDRGAVHVALHQDWREGACRCALTVRDTGRGIPAAELGSVFDQFYRGDGARSAATGGAGLGLAITRRLVEAMGGRISVESVPGAGTVFAVRLTLPLVR